VAEPPGEAETRGGARSAIATARDQGRDRRQMIRVGRVPKAEDDCDDDDQREGRPVRELCDPVVEPNISTHLREGADGHCEAGGEDDQGARGGQETDETPFEARPPEEALGEDGDEADAGDAEGQAGAEGDDQ